MLIRNDKQREQSAKMLAEMQAAVKAETMKYQSQGHSAEEIKALIDPQLSLLDDVQQDIEIYDRWKTGDLTDFEAAGLDSLGRFLIASRIAKGVSQRTLAQKMNVNESTVSRDECNEYHGITIARAIKVLEALDVEVLLDICPLVMVDES